MRAKIIEIVEKNTEKQKASTVTQCSSILEKNKNYIAREMNQLVEEDLFFSVLEKEVLYFHKSVFEHENNCTIGLKRYQSIAELMNSISINSNKDFGKLIGEKGSLSRCVEQCKAAISYPPYSLPILLYGPTGTGKSYIAQLMYEYAINQQIIDSDKPFVTVNCSEYANNPELLTANLFGHKKGAFTGADKDNEGLIQIANGGVLFLDEVHCLKAECQEKLFLFMDKGIYHKVGENKKWETAQTRLIFATTEKPEEVLLRTLLRRIPITVTIPSLKERGVYERTQLIYSVFSQESENIDRKIQLSNFVYNMFVYYDFDGNIGELKNTIKVCCANALSESKTEIVQIHMRHLPDIMFSKKIDVKFQAMDTDHRMMDLSDIKNQWKINNRLIDLFERMLDNYANIQKNKDVNRLFLIIREFQNYFIFEKKEKENHRYKYILNVITDILDQTIKRYDLDLSNNDILMIMQYIEFSLKQSSQLNCWEDENDKLIQNFKETLRSCIQRDLLISEEIVENIQKELDLSFRTMFTCILAIYLNMLNTDLQKYKRLGIILAHGYSTASSIAQATNQLIGKHVFESIDMPVEMGTHEIVDLLNDYLGKIKYYEEVILLVDMGSLEDIYQGLNPEINSNIGIMNNITTKIALQIGYELTGNESLETILSQACQQNHFRYKVIEKKKKEDVIICACASGLGTAEKIKQLLISSLPANINLTIMTYDYNQLLNEEARKELFQSYHCLCVIGTLNPDIEGLKFIPIEELIVDQDIGAMEKIFNSYLKEEEIEIFKRNLLKNFSLTNIMNHLTILNPVKLLEHVAKALDDFQRLYQVQLANRVSVGLYVHTCCMIERLVKNQPFDNYPEVENLKKEQGHFIQCLKKSFEDVEKYYNVSINEDEMGFIFDYIQNNS